MIPILSVHISGIPEVRKALLGAVDPRPMMDAAADSVSNLVTRHLLARNKRPSRPGWPSSNYWGDAAASTQTQVSSTDAIVTIHAPGIRLHLEGGKVTPKSGKSLAIPARPEVARVWPSTYSGKERVFLLVRKAFGKAYLAERQGDGHLRILWRLVKMTRHKADPSVLPPPSALADTAKTAILSILPKK